MKLYVIVLLFMAGSLSHAETYVVKKGDSLASIARARYGEPVFGRGGTIKKIYKLNSWAKPDVPLEPGQKVELEDKAGQEAAPVAKDSAIEPAESPTLLSPVVITEDRSKTVTPEQHAAQQMDMSPHGPLPEESKPPLVFKDVPVAAAEPHHEVAGVAEHEEMPRNYFSIIPSYSFITQSASENDSGASFTMHSGPAWGAELGWDHWWNDSFSTILTYAITQFTSKETADATGEKVLKNANLNQTELALLNRVVRWMRIGAGAAYGDHIFLESLDGIPQNPQVYKLSYFNPFLMAEITPMESAKYELILNFKVSELPAQVGLGHDVNTGTEYFGEVAFQQKLSRFSMLYGVSCSTENQTRTDGKESRSETALRVGVLF
jgi:hypothetical protein